MTSEIATAHHLAIVAEHVEKYFLAGIPGCRARVAALRGATLRVREGESVVLVGGSGAGKTTLLLCMAGLLRVDGGMLRWFGGRIPDGARVAYVRTLPQAYEAAERLAAHASGILLIDIALHALSHEERCDLECLVARTTEGGMSAILASREVPTMRPTWRKAFMVRGVVHELPHPDHASNALPVRVAEERVVVG